MPKKRKVQLRRCSLCGKTGHNRARCELNLKKNKVEKTAKIKQENHLLKNDSLVSAPKTAKSKIINIKHNQLTYRSPHVINLKKEEKNIWNDIQIWQQKPVAKEKRVVVDLAGMVRQANNRPVVEVIEKIVARPVVVPAKKLKIKKTHRAFGLVMKEFFENIKHDFTSRVEDVRTSLGNTSHNFKNAFSFRKLVYSTLVILLLASLPFPSIAYYRSVKDTSSKVVEESTNAFLSLQSSTVAAFQSNLDQAQYDLNSALQSFDNATSIMDKEHTALQFVAGLLPVVGKQVTSRQHLLTAGHHLALGNTYLVKGIRESENSDLNMNDRIKVLANHLKSSIPQYEEALKQLSSVSNEVVPVEYQAAFSEFKVLFATLIDDMKDITSLSSALDSIFGGDQLKRYLLVFQNNNEIRPTGGFMGSFALLDIQKGKILNIDIPGGGTYDLKGQLKTEVEPPTPLLLSNKRWEFQDANWFPDFSASAEKMEWFYEQSRNTSVDGVIAINATVLERLLKVLGPVENETYNLSLDEDSALTTLQQEVEIDYDKESNKPKQVIADLASQFLSQTGKLDAVSAVKLLSELNEALNQKEIQVYFNDEHIQNKIKSFGWTGEVSSINNHQDYLLVVNTNIQGQKSDAKIKQVVEHQAFVQEDGTIYDTVIVHRSHLGTKGEQFYGVNNVNYIRVYVPAGSELIQAGGFAYPAEDSFKVPEDWYIEDTDLAEYEEEIGFHPETGTRITNEFGKTAFGNWMMTEPGEASSVYFTYKLPFKAWDQNNKIDKTWKDYLAVTKVKDSSRYSLVVQKQSGINSDFSTRVIYPTAWYPVWSSNERIELASNGMEYNGVLNKDLVLGLVVESNN